MWVIVLLEVELISWVYLVRVLWVILGGGGV